MTRSLWHRRPQDAPTAQRVIAYAREHGVSWEKACRRMGLDARWFSKCAREVETLLCLAALARLQQKDSKHG